MHQRSIPTMMNGFQRSWMTARDGVTLTTEGELRKCTGWIDEGGMGA